MSESFVDPNTATPAAEPATPAPSTPTPATSATPAGSPTTTPTPAPATSGAPEGYVPSYRLRETREAAIREAQNLVAQRDAQYQAEIEQYRQKLAALAGITPPQQNTQADTVRQQFAQLFPGLAKIEQRAADLEQLIERAGELENQTTHYWQTYGRQVSDRLFSLAQESVGAPLNDEAKRVLHSSFVGFLQSSPELAARYESDPTIVEDFWKAYTSNFIDPVRRSAGAQVAGRVPQNLPQDTPSGAPRATPAPQMNGLDERAAAAWAQFQTMRNRG